MPDRTTVGRWRRRYLSVLEEVFVEIADILQRAIPAKIAVVDSTSLVGFYDVEAQWGHTGRGKFRGFKLHAAVNRFDGSISSKADWGFGGGLRVG